MNDERSQTPTLGGTIRRLIADALADVHVSIPGIVQEYDSSTQRATVQPALKRSYVDAAGDRAVERLPVVVSVPVVFPGAGAYSITFPIEKGDTVLLVFSERSIDRWLSYGGEVDPRVDHRFDLSDAIAVPGLRHNAVDGVADGAMVLTAPEIRLGDKDAADPVARKSDIDALIDIYNAHTHADPSSGSTGTPSVTMSDIDGSSKVKVD